MKTILTLILVTMFSQAQAAVLDATCRDSRGSFRAEIILRDTARGVAVGARGARDFDRGFAVTVPRLVRRGTQVTGADTHNSELGFKFESVAMTGTTLRLVLTTRGAAFGTNNLSMSCSFDVTRDADDLRHIMRDLRQE